MYLTRMEESYLHFDKAAEAFVHESPTLLLEERESSSANAFSVQLDNQVSSSCSNQMASACMAQKGVAASSTKDDHASSVSFHTSLPTSQNGIAPSSQIGATAPPPLPTVSTGPTRARSRSYSVDLVTRPSSSLNPDRSDQITVSLRSRCDIGRSPSHPHCNSILHLHRGLSVVLRLLRHFRDLAQRHKEPLLRALFAATQCPVLPPTATTPRQYELYLRVLTHTVGYAATLQRLLGLRSRSFAESLAACLLQLLLHHPKQTVGSPTPHQLDGTPRRARLRPRRARRPRGRSRGTPAVAAAAAERRRAVRRRAAGAGNGRRRGLRDA